MAWPLFGLGLTNQSCGDTSDLVVLSLSFGCGLEPTQCVVDKLDKLVDNALCMKDHDFITSVRNLPQWKPPTPGQ